MKIPVNPPSGREPTPPGPRAADQSLQQQLGRLFGESLFGPWPDSQGVLAQGHRPRRGRMLRRMGLALLLVLTASGIGLYRRTVTPQRDQGRSNLAAEVNALLQEGSLDRLGVALQKLSPADKPLAAEDPHLDVILSAQAALYRYHDAPAERLARIEPFLSNDSAHPARLLARLTVASRPERVAAHEIMVKLPASHAQGSEYHALMATIHEERGDVPAARASWEQSQNAGSHWLPHRYLQCAFEARQSNHEAVARVIAHMTRVAPDSTWTRMAQQHFSRTTTTGVAADSPPVARYFAELAPLFQGLVTRNLVAARQALGRALAAVNDQAAFVLDAFRELRQGKADALAMELTSYEAWPRGNPWARGALAALQASQADDKRGAQPASAPADPASDSRKKPAQLGGKKKSGPKATSAKKASKVKSRRGPR